MSENNGTVEGNPEEPRRPWKTDTDPRLFSEKQRSVRNTASQLPSEHRARIEYLRTSRTASPPDRPFVEEDQILANLLLENKINYILMKSGSESQTHHYKPGDTPSEQAFRFFSGMKPESQSQHGNKNDPKVVEFKTAPLSMKAYHDLSKRIEQICAHHGVDGFVENSYTDESIKNGPLTHQISIIFPRPYVAEELENELKVGKKRLPKEALPRETAEEYGARMERTRTALFDIISRAEVAQHQQRAASTSRA